jgi:hypothetical protein
MTQYILLFCIDGYSYGSLPKEKHNDVDNQPFKSWYVATYSIHHACRAIYFSLQSGQFSLAMIAPNNVITINGIKAEIDGDKYNLSLCEQKQSKNVQKTSLT